MFGNASATDAQKHPRPIIALGFDDDSLTLLCMASGVPFGVLQFTTKVDGLCKDLVGQQHTVVTHGKKPRFRTSEAVSHLTDNYNQSSIYGLFACQLRYSDGDDRYELNVSTLTCSVRHIGTASDEPLQSLRLGAKVPLERLNIRWGNDGLPTVELRSDIITRSRMPLEVLIGDEDRVLLVMNDSLSKGLVVVDTRVPGAQQYHADRVTGSVPSEIMPESREYKEYRVPEQAIREATTSVLMDCSWTAGGVMHELHGIGRPISTYIPEPDGSRLVLAASDPRWVIITRDGEKLLIGFKPYFE